MLVAAIVKTVGRTVAPRRRPNRRRRRSFQPPSTRGGSILHQDFIEQTHTTAAEHAAHHAHTHAATTTATHADCVNLVNHQDASAVLASQLPRLRVEPHTVRLPMPMNICWKLVPDAYPKGTPASVAIA